MNLRDALFRGIFTPPNNVDKPPQSDAVNELKDGGNDSGGSGVTKEKRCDKMDTGTTGSESTTSTSTSSSTSSSSSTPSSSSSSSSSNVIEDGDKSTTKSTNNSENDDETDSNATASCEKDLVDSALPPVDRKQQRLSELQKLKANCKSEDLDKLKMRCEILVRDCIAGLLMHLSEQDFKEMEGELGFPRGDRYHSLIRFIFR